MNSDEIILGMNDEGELDILDENTLFTEEQVKEIKKLLTQQAQEIFKELEENVAHIEEGGILTEAIFYQHVENIKKKWCEE